MRMSSGTTTLVRSAGLLHGLPVFPDAPELRGLTAVITGANGMTGSPMVKVLASSPERWKKIYCLSRRPPSKHLLDSLGESAASRVEHITADFFSKPEELAELLTRSIQKIDCAFYYSYVQPPSKTTGPGGQWSNSQELSEANATLLSNFLGALQISKLIPKRFLLQTGAKHYGFHDGPTATPCFESDPRVTTEPNFYYPQEDMLFKFCADFGVRWNVVRPSFIIGAVEDSALNHLVGLAAYAAIQAHLRKPLEFPGDYVAWDREFCQSTALLNSHMQQWAVLSSNTANQAFNMQDGDPFTCCRLWPFLADCYGAQWVPPEIDDTIYISTLGTHATPPRGYGPRGTTRYAWTFFKWSQRPEVEKAWAELTEMHGLKVDIFKKRAIVFGHADAAILSGWPLSLSMHKARKFGWYGFADPYESTFVCLQEMAKMKMVVPTVGTQYKGY